MRHSSISLEVHQRPVELSDVVGRVERECVWLDYQCLHAHLFSQAHEPLHTSAARQLLLEDSREAACKEHMLPAAVERHMSTEIVSERVDARLGG